VKVTECDEHSSLTPDQDKDKDFFSMKIVKKFPNSLKDLPGQGLAKIRFIVGLPDQCLIGILQ
jgi:hypothetical protein